MNEIVIWILIIFCLIQSAIFSGMTIGVFGLGRLRLEIEAEADNKEAIKILQIRRDSNFLLTTLLWGNIGVNVLIALLTGFRADRSLSFPLLYFRNHKFRRDRTPGLFFPKRPVTRSKTNPCSTLLPDAAISCSQAHSPYS